MTEPLENTPSAAWDTSSHQEFYEYYAELSAREETMERFRILRDSLLSVYAHLTGGAPADVLDVGCNSGSLSRVWAEKGVRVAGVDINEPLLSLARQRAADDGVEIDFRVGSATELPYADGAFDVCCIPELLEHVEDWQACLREAARVLRPGGVVYASTTNWLCPRQHEYRLPLYSWYPGFLKRHFERLAVTTRPEVANFATYPAIHWFSYYRLRRFFRTVGMESLDRFDVAEIKKASRRSTLVAQLVRRVPGLRLLGHIATPGTSIVAYKPGN